jgi:hypothetical protein
MPDHGSVDVAEFVLLDCINRQFLCTGIIGQLLTEIYVGKSELDAEFDPVTADR